MSKIIATTRRRKLRGKTYLWMLGSLGALSALIYWEQTALLYAISTLAMCLLLIVVAFAKIENEETKVIQSVEIDNEAIGNRVREPSGSLSGSRPETMPAKGEILTTPKAVLFDEWRYTDRE